MEKFADRLKELREESGLSLTALAKEIGCSQVAVGRWEAKVRTPNIETLVLLAKFFGVTSDYLLGLED